MKSKIFLACFVVMCGQGFAQIKADPAGKSISSAAHPIVGVWTSTVHSKACAETWKYRNDGSRLATSGQEVLQGSYDISPIASAQGFYSLDEKVSKSNSKKDCSGDEHRPSNESVTRFIQFSPKQDQLIVCKAESLRECFGPFKRVPE